MDGSDGAPPCGLLGFSERVVEPEGPGVLKWVRGGVERRGGRGGVVGDLALLPVVVVRHGAAPGAGGRGPGVGLIGHGGGGVFRSPSSLGRNSEEGRRKRKESKETRGWAAAMGWARRIFHLFIWALVGLAIIVSVCLEFPTSWL